MAWYRANTCSLTSGSPAINGASTAWVANAQAGDAFKGPDEKLYEVQSVNSDTSITLASNYTGTTLAGAAYAIIPTQGRVRDLAAAVLQLITDMGDVDAALTVVSGRVGLGKSPNASAKLDVSGQVWVDAPTGDATLRMLASGVEKGKLAVTSAGRAYIESNGAEVMTLLNGTVGIGTTAPATRLEVAGTSPVARVSGLAGSAPRLELSSAGVVNWGLRSNSSGGSEFTIFQDAAERIRISSAGNVTINAPSSGIALNVSGALALSAPTYTAAATYTVLASDSCLRSGATCTVTLPAAASFTGRILRIANIGAFAVTSASANVGQQATGTAATAILPATAGKWADLQSDGSFWYITASN